MKIKKRYVGLVSFAILTVAFGAISYSWTHTAYGRLDYAAALSTRALTANVTLKPDPNSDFEFKMPINLLFAVSAFLPNEHVSETRDITISGEGAEIPARVYWPAERGSPQSLALIVYYHGGGFVLGSVKTFDGLARSISNATGAIVISVDYRLAPAHPYPAAVNDAYAALQWVAANAALLGGDGSKLVVAGDSAGGNIAAVTALRARDQGGPALAAQILYYPATDLTDARYESQEHFIDGYGLSSDARAAFRRAYIGHVANRADAFISPIYAPNLAGLPPALIITAGFDPLTDSAEAYARRMEQSGVRVTSRNYPDTIHGFMSVPLFSQRRQALNATAEFWKEIPGLSQVL